jgi:hypothetical protein
MRQFANNGSHHKTVLNCLAPSNIKPGFGPIRLQQFGLPKNAIHRQKYRDDEVTAEAKHDSYRPQRKMEIMQKHDELQLRYVSTCKPNVRSF